ncbi:MAG: hypothetical protein A3G41_06355 [Elusimicrobia bacterium RIFCSPLOWO2_12_FULL_59_9]|nr:MAG: hypothetical protein A3G41_06355 [Elusimicrobia bacterium RIFCSPLOWO2_12_FULL_59_9]
MANGKVIKVAQGNSVWIKDYYFLSLQRLEEWPDKLDLPSGFFGLMLCMDAGKTDRDHIFSAAAKALENGLCCFSAWGPGCEFTHDVFDQAILKKRPDPEERDEKIILTTWHADESLDEALHDFALLAVPADFFQRRLNDWLIVSVGNKDWDAKIQHRLSDLKKLNDDVLGQEKQ